MKANELRIGNLLNYETGEGISPTVIDWQDLKWLTENPDDFNKHHSPILLTEEWLLKFGFDKINHIYDGIIYKKEHIKCGVNKKDWYLRGAYIKNPIEYVHRLQNLYFALTGQELEIKQNQ